jgi:hypothetical protein
MRPLLADKAQLVRFDAISALWTDGGSKGKQLVREHRKSEKNPWLSKMLKSLDSEKAP